MKKIIQRIDFINNKLGVLTAYLIFPMIIITFLVAFMRYALDLGSIAIQEIIIYLHAMVFSFGAAYTLKDDKHVRIDIFYSNFRKKTKKKHKLNWNIFFSYPYMCFNHYHKLGLRNFFDSSFRVFKRSWRPSYTLYFKDIYIIFMYNIIFSGCI